MRKGTVIYPYEPWTITENSFDVKTNRRNETIFAVANGYIGMRGSFEEGLEDAAIPSSNGTYLNGFYDSTPIIYGEEAFGYARNHQTMLNVTDSKIIELIIDGEKFSLNSGTVNAYSRQLDMRKGILFRKVFWETKTGKQMEITIERMVSLTNKHLACIRYRVKPLNFSGELKFISAINGEVHNQVSNGDPRAGSVFSSQVLQTQEIFENDTFGAIRQQTKVTCFDLVCAMEHQMNISFSLQTKILEQRVEKYFTVHAIEQEAVILDKFIAYYSSKDYPKESLLSRAEEELNIAKEKGYDTYKQGQQAVLDSFWEHADITVEGDDALQQGLRFNAYHLFQSVGRDSKTNIAAKGLTGEGYDGHYFWDSETYIIPFFLYTNPEIAKQLLKYRIHTLPKAKQRAAELAQKGAMFPWRTIDGEEASACYPAGTAQYHINADIAYAFKAYAEVTGDMEFIYEHGLSVLLETSRFFADFGVFIEGKGFCINGVTGPDEYTAIVNNNTYTNIMVKDLLEYIILILQKLIQEQPERWIKLCSQFDISEAELNAWQAIANQIYIHHEKGLIGQDDSFLQKAVWDFSNTPKDKYPLLLHYHPLNIYRHQVLKQADLVLAFYLQRDRFTRTEKVRNYLYYEPLTTHDSSLSSCIYGIVAAELGFMDKAYDYFMHSVRTDLDDYHDNTQDGIHCASMAGSRLAIVNGFAGMHHNAQTLIFEPKIPINWQSYGFRIKYKGRLLELQVMHEKTIYRLLEGEPMTIRHYDQDIALIYQSEMPNRRLDAVIFDLDGVITDTAEYHYAAWKELADEQEIPFDRAYNEQLKGVDRNASLELILKRTSKVLPEEEKLALAMRKNERYKEFICSITPDDILPGVKELLQELKQLNIKVALASVSKNAKAVIASLQIAAYFDYIVDASTVEIGKPDPEVFLKAAEALGVHPVNCVGIEDAAAGIEAILLAGMKAVGVGDSLLLNKADVVVQNMKAVNVQQLKELLYGEEKRSDQITAQS